MVGLFVVIYTYFNGLNFDKKIKTTTKTHHKTLIFSNLKIVYGLEKVLYCLILFELYLCNDN